MFGWSLFRQKFFKFTFQLLFISLTSALTSISLAHGARRPSQEPASPLLGRWKFYKMILDGQEMPPHDPRLDLEYEFLPSGVNRLYWTYDEGKTFCERKGQYMYKDGFLMDEVVWVNPKNKSDCATDVDMQMGRRATSKLDITPEGDIKIHIPFSDKEMLYVWKKLPDAPAN